MQASSIGFVDCKPVESVLNAAQQDNAFEINHYHHHDHHFVEKESKLMSKSENGIRSKVQCYYDDSESASMSKKPKKSSKLFYQQRNSNRYIYDYDEPLNEVYQNLAKFLTRQLCRNFRLRRPLKYRKLSLNKQQQQMQLEDLQQMKFQETHEKCNDEQKRSKNMITFNQQPLTGKSFSKIKLDLSLNADNKSQSRVSKVSYNYDDISLGSDLGSPFDLNASTSNNKFFNSNASINNQNEFDDESFELFNVNASHRDSINYDFDESGK
jgi:hypothetical protein